MKLVGVAAAACLICSLCVPSWSAAEGEAAQNGARGGAVSVDCVAIDAHRLATEAKRVLDDNWIGRSTKPGKRL